MSRFICCVLLLTFCSAVFPQKVYFVYLQSESGQSFFVKINEKAYNSTSAGYIILPQLKDSSYNFKIGFPQNKWPDQQFSVDIKSKDRGYLLKSFGEKGWGLFDLQTLGVQMSAENKANDKTLKTEMKDVSAFTEILSKAANDPSLKEKPVFAVIKKAESTENIQSAVAKEDITVLKEQPAIEPKTQIKKEAKVETVQSGVAKEEKTGLKEQSVDEPVTQFKKETPPTVKEEAGKKEISPVAVTPQDTILKTEEVKTAPLREYKKSVVIKRSESSTTDGFGLTFVDQYTDGQKDTIQIIIPNSNALLVKEKGPSADEKKFLDITEHSEESKSTNVRSITYSGCGSIASESDFLKLRKKMAGQKTEEAMINEAKKGFKLKCFTNEQIKNLGNLFLNEAGKFQFYEAAYPYSSDRDNFNVLQTELKENYFIHRFKGMVKTSSL